VAKVNVSIPENVLQELDKAARQASTSRSALLSEAARKYLQDLEEQRQVERRRQAARSIRKLAQKIGRWDGTSEILKWRNAH